MNPRVSVITIFYNAGDFIAEAIDSVLAQDFRDFELLLVDDGSTDASGDMARRYADGERIKVLHHPGGANRGMSASRNLGIREARGELVAFIDADDRWRPDKLSDQVAIFNHIPEVDAAFGSVNYWSSWSGGEDRIVATGHVHDRPIAPSEASIALYPLGSAAAPCPSDLMVRRSVALALGGFDESFTGPLQMYEDQAFLAKLYLKRASGSTSAAGSIIVSTRPPASRRFRAMGSMTRSGATSSSGWTNISRTARSFGHPPSPLPSIARAGR